MLSPSPAASATCTSSVGPGIAPPAFVVTGIPGFHATWYGQSGYMTLCPGDQATATVAYINSGSRGWVSGRSGETAYLGTSGPEPGQDRQSQIGGDGRLGSPNTGWPSYNRLAVQPAAYVGPGQVAWFQFKVQAPAVPGTYRIALRPLVEGSQWMEDYGVFWVVTVPPTSTPVATPAPPVQTPKPTAAPVATPAPTAAAIAPPVASVVRTCIDDEFSGWAPDAVFELCNGQVWIQLSSTYRYSYRYRPSVTLTRSVAGWTMSVEGITGSVAVQEVAFMRTCIEGTFNGWDGETLFPLCNGQIWQQATYAYRYKYAYRPRVLIYESPDGRYYMIVNGDYENAVRVTRVR